MWRRLGELIALFVKLGSISFGGPAAHLALMEEEVVARRRWMTRQQFLDLWGATYFIPGPNALEMTAHVGYQRAGWVGLVVSAVCFVLPAALLSGALAWAYLAYGSLPQIAPFLQGVKPAVLALIAVALWRLGRTAIKGWLTAMLASGVAVAALLGGNEVLVLLAATLLGTMVLRGEAPPGSQPAPVERGSPPAPAPDAGGNASPPECRVGASHPSADGGLGACVESTHPPGAGATACVETTHCGDPMSQTAPTFSGCGIPVLLAGAMALAPSAVPLGPLTLFFLKVGAVLYGTGYVLIAYLEGGLVRDLGWLTRQQLIDAVAVGQITPGPLITTATFVGYVLAGPAGAAAATAGIILPGLAAVAITSPWIGQLRQWPWTARFLDSVGAASLGLTAAVTVALCRGVLVDWQSLAIAAVSCLALLRWRLNPAWLILAGAVAGWLLGG